MLFRIAEKLGMTVSRLQNELTFAEFLEWCIHLKMSAQEENGEDPSCPFPKDHPDYDMWMLMKEVQGKRDGDGGNQGTF